MRPLSALLLLACGQPDAGSLEETGDRAAPAAPAGLEAALTLEGLLAHIDALQAIADAHGDSRDASGFLASADYAASVLQEAGYEVQRLPFTFQSWSQAGPSVLTTTADGEAPGSWADGPDILALRGSPSGDHTAPLHPVALSTPPQGASDSGCEAGHFAGFPAGGIALIQRGTCTFATKAQHAADAGAVAVVVFNHQPGTIERWDLGEGAELPVLGATHAVGEALVEALGQGEVVARVRIEADLREHASENILADTPWGDPDRVVVVGAHLDSVPDGPGINDNGSGTALVLELAVHATEGEPLHNRLRFALWGAEEVGLVGSMRYVSGLSDAERARLLANLNYDMIASPNGLPFIYDGDGSDFGVSGPPGSDRIEHLHAEWFEAQGLPFRTTALDGRSDYLGFLLAGVPAGGLFSGAEGRKSEEEAAVHGGEAVSAYDPCYHRACDDRDNLDPDLFLQLSRAAAHVTGALAQEEGRLGSARRAWTAADLQAARRVEGAQPGCAHEQAPDR